MVMRQASFSAPRQRGILAVALLSALLSWLTPAAADDKPARPRLRPSGIDGALVLCGDGKVADGAARRFVELAGAAKAHLVVLATGDGPADKETTAKRLRPWQDRQPASVSLLQTGSRKTAAEAGFVTPLREATGVWLEEDSPARFTEIYGGTAVAKELRALLQRGGVVGGSGAASRLCGRLTPAEGKDAKTVTGLDLLPGTVVDTLSPEADGNRRLFSVLDRDPALLGLALDRGTALVVRGRQVRVLGEGAVTVCLAGATGRPPRTVEVKAGDGSDLTMWRRAALARSEPAFPPKEAPVPEVPGRGALVIVGGGAMPAEVTKKFIELAGGPDALIVVLPTAQPDPIPATAEGAFLKKAGARNVETLPGRDLADVESLKYQELLKKAGGIWFGGGRQWRFVDAYEGTRAEPLFRELLRRGGVIGGSSAGATIQGDYLCRGSPLGNTEIQCEGYERGLGFLPGVAIDQHFAQRQRFADMTGLMKSYPQLLGVGLDESTAIVVRGHVAEVLGRNQVHFYDAKKPHPEGKPDYESLAAGGRYDLKARQALADGEQPKR
jgi:cyanophycinase